MMTNCGTIIPCDWTLIINYCWCIHSFVSSLVHSFVRSFIPEHGGTSGMGIVCVLGSERLFVTYPSKE